MDAEELPEEPTTPVQQTDDEDTTLNEPESAVSAATTTGTGDTPLGPISKDDKHGVDHRLDHRVRLEIVRRLLDKYWKPDGIARDLNVSIKTVYRIKNNLIKYGSAVPPREKTLGRPKGLTKEDEDFLLERLTRQPQMNLRQLTAILEEERGVTVSRSTLSRVLTARRGPSTTALNMKERKPRKSVVAAAVASEVATAAQQAAQAAGMADPNHDPNIDTSLQAMDAAMHVSVATGGGSSSSMEYHHDVSVVQQQQQQQQQQPPQQPPAAPQQAPQAQQQQHGLPVGTSGLIG